MEDCRRLTHFDHFLLPSQLKLSMVTGNGVNSNTQTLRPSYKPFRKMADVGVQVEDFPSLEDPTEVNSTVAEINTVAEVNTIADINNSREINNAAVEIDDLDNKVSASSSVSSHRPLSSENSTSSSGSDYQERRKPLTNQEDVDAIFVQQSQDEDRSAAVALNNNEKTELDGFSIEEEKEDSNCGLDCVYFTMKCCECTIL